MMNNKVEGIRGAIDPRLTDASISQEERNRIAKHYAANPTTRAQ